MTPCNLCDNNAEEDSPICPVCIKRMEKEVPMICTGTETKHVFWMLREHIRELLPDFPFPEDMRANERSIIIRRKEECEYCTHVNKSSLFSQPILQGLA